MATMHVITALTLLLILSLASRPCQAWKKDIKVKYYSSAVLRCHQNLTVIPNTSRVFWITPDAGLLTKTTPARDFPKNVQLVSNDLITLLNVTEVTDEQFGYYTCVMVQNNDQVLLARWGLNVDGADFSELEEQYRKNAVVGAIAAAAMIVLLGGACLIWHFRYSKRSLGESGGVGGGVEDDLRKPCGNVYHNQGYDDPLPEGVNVPEPKGPAGSRVQNHGRAGDTESSENSVTAM